MRSSLGRSSRAARSSTLRSQPDSGTSQPADGLRHRRRRAFGPDGEWEYLVIEDNAKMPVGIEPMNILRARTPDVLPESYKALRVRPLDGLMERFGRGRAGRFARARSRLWRSSPQGPMTSTTSTTRSSPANWGRSWPSGTRSSSTAAGGSSTKRAAAGST